MTITRIENSHLIITPQQASLKPEPTIIAGWLEGGRRGAHFLLRFELVQAKSGTLLQLHKVNPGSQSWVALCDSRSTNIIYNSGRNCLNKKTKALIPDTITVPTACLGIENGPLKAVTGILLVQIMKQRLNHKMKCRLPVLS